MKSWVSAARPKTLLASVAPVCVGTALGFVDGARVIRWDLAIAALGGCLCLQVATNYFNDAIDFRKGADTEKRLGPQRASASGALSAEQMVIGALVMLAWAILFSLPMIVARGWPIVVIGVPSLFLCYGYTGGPLPVAYRGFGELFVIIFFGWIAVGGSYFLQTGSWDLGAFIAGTQIGLLSTVLIAVNNLRDIEEDRQSGKRTLAVRFGKTFGRREILALFLTAYACGLLWVVAGKAPLVWATLPAIPLAVIIVIGILRNEPGTIYNKFLGMSALHLLFFSSLLILGLVFLT